MKYSNIVTGIVTALLLSACGGSGSDCGFDAFCLRGVVPITFTVDAGPDQNVIAGDMVELAGSADHSHSLLVFQWSQLSGPTVSLIAPGFAITSFKAPAVSNTTSLSFRFTATTVSTAIPVSSKSDDVTIVVEPTSASALCLQAPLFATNYAWANSGCTTDSADIVGDSHIATVYRQGEAEPNDSPQSASPLTFPMRIATERTATDVAGSISAVDSDLDDFVVFTPPETGAYEIYLCNDPLVCMRGTLTSTWFLSLSDQNLDVIAGTIGGQVVEQVVRVELEAGLPYYVGIHVWDSSSTTWEYNLTIISGSN